MGTSKVNSSRKTALERERDSKINVTMPAGHMLPLTFAFDFMASYFRISSVVPGPEPVIFKRFRFRLRPQPSGSTGSGTGSGSASLVRAPFNTWFRGLTQVHTPKRHPDWFSRFSTAHGCDQQTDTRPVASVTMGRIFDLTLRACDAA